MAVLVGEIWNCTSSRSMLPTEGKLSALFPMSSSQLIDLRSESKRHRVCGNRATRTTRFIALITIGGLHEQTRRRRTSTLETAVSDYTRSDLIGFLRENRHE